MLDLNATWCQLTWDRALSENKVWMLKIYLFSWKAHFQQSKVKQSTFELILQGHLRIQITIFCTLYDHCWDIRETECMTSSGRGTSVQYCMSGCLLFSFDLQFFGLAPPFPVISTSHPLKITYPLDRWSLPSMAWCESYHKIKWDCSILIFQKSRLGALSILLSTLWSHALMAPFHGGVCAPCVNCSPIWYSMCHHHHPPPPSPLAHYEQNSC